MTRTALTWLRVVFPPVGIVGLMVVLCLGTRALELWVAHRLEIHEKFSLFAPFRVMLIGVASVAYGMYRVLVFHPLFRSGYRTWLAATPWTSAKPLPLGPIHLVPQDAVMLGLLFALVHEPGGVVEMPNGVVVHVTWLAPLCFLISYLLWLCTSFTVVGLAVPAYATAFGLGLVFRLSREPAWATGAAAIVYLVAWWGIRQSLARFLWRVPRFLDPVRSERQGSESRQPVLGWAFNALQPKPVGAGIRVRDALAVSLLVGWWAHSVVALIANEQEQREAVTTISGFVTAGCVLSRTVVYCLRHWPPISLWGRIQTLRWIIPGYDRVFVAPLCALAAGLILHWLVAHDRLPADIFGPAGIAVVLAITLGTGPTLQQWQLTGAHRIAPDYLNKANFIEL
ncbi:MAG: hypothetical protein NUV77_00920 [Thermoguttaceae bacterium]|jgi:hypothetical protein|nr:hypothetical protein [Thermoguttaceae bacterium]